MQNTSEQHTARNEQFPPQSSRQEHENEPVQEPRQAESSDTSQTPEKKERSIGALFSIVIIVGLLIVGALYFWGKWIDIQAQQEATLQNLYNQENVEVVE